MYKEDKGLRGASLSPADIKKGLKKHHLLSLSFKKGLAYWLIPFDRQLVGE